MTRKLVATYGVRYDQYRSASGIANAPLAETRSFRTPMGNFAPRVSASPTRRNPTMVVRLSGGMFYEPTPYQQLLQPAVQQRPYEHRQPDRHAWTHHGRRSITFPNTFTNVPVARRCRRRRRSR